MRNGGSKYVNVDQREFSLPLILFFVRVPGKSSSNLVAASASSPTTNDTHNETTASEMSGDITLDSVKDHTMYVNTRDDLS